MKPLSLQFALLLTALVGACENADAGETQPGCVEVRSALGYDERTRSGQTPRELMELYGGSFEGKLTWHGGTDGAGKKVIDVSPSHGETSLSVELAYEGGSIWMVERSPAADGRLACPESIVIESAVRLQSSDGALAGAWQVEASTHVGGGGELAVTIADFLASNEGTFSAKLTEPDAWDDGTENVEVFLDFEGAGVVGNITSSAERTFPAQGDLKEGLILVADLATWSLPRSGT